MLNKQDEPPRDASEFNVIDYADPLVKERMAAGQLNTDDVTLAANIASAIRRGYTQMRPGPLQPQRICLVGSGPSLADTEDELRQLIWEGAILVTVNGAYHWCIEHGFLPKTQIVMDARPTNARFVEPAVPHCRYVLASQCAPETWDAVKGRPDVWIFHAVVKEGDGIAGLLDKYYAGQWFGVGGGTTVATRAIHLLRMAGYVRFDLFGIDCCWKGAQHHAIAQPENEGDRRFKMTLTVDGHAPIDFWLSPWHLKQFEDFMAVLKLNGHHFQLAIHGSGMLAHAIRLLGTDASESMSLQMHEEDSHAAAIL